MCDLCANDGRPGDRDKPYQYGRRELTVLRLTRRERQLLVLLKHHLQDVKNGYAQGRGYGDLSADPIGDERG